MINVIDVFNSGRFLGALVRTMQQVFPTSRCFRVGRTMTGTTRPPRDVRRRRRVARAGHGGARQSGQGSRRSTAVCLTAEEMRLIDERSRGMILTDDYAPVENLLATVVRRGR